jgi:membrane fusion protein (multidrug efflux system)
LAIALVGGYYYATSGRYVSTENAYVKSATVFVSAEVSGRVVAVAVSENQHLEAGALLFRLDDEPFRLALQRTEARLAGVVQEIEAYRATWRRQQAELRIAEDDVAYLERETERQRRLRDKRVLSEAKFDEVRHRLGTARSRIAAIRETIALALTKLGGDPNLPAARHPHYRQVLAERDQARMAFDDAVVRAPIAGIVSNLELQAGEYVKAGAALFGLVAPSPLWIEVNLKETELTHVRPGQAAQVRFDAYPEHQWPARVASLSAATGAEFALLPPQNASGNWVKVVQRLPLRLNLEARPRDAPLRAGMSVQVRIDTGFERPLPAIVKSALAWVQARK